MTQDEAEKLAREYLRGYGSNETACRLCDHILSGSRRREIENAAFERAAVQLDRAAKDSDHSKVARAAFQIAARFVRALIQPPAQKENGE